MNIEKMTKNEIAIELEEVHGIKLSNKQVKTMKKAELSNLLKRERWEREIEAADKEDAAVLNAESNSAQETEQVSESKPEPGQTQKPESEQVQKTEPEAESEQNQAPIPEIFHLILEVPEFYHDFFTLQIMVSNMVKNKVAQGNHIKVYLNGTESKSILYAVEQLGFECTFNKFDNTGSETFGVIIFTNNTMIPNVMLSLTEWNRIKAPVKVFNYETKLWMQYEHIVSYIQRAAG